MTSSETTFNDKELSISDATLIARLRLYGSKFHHEFGHNDAADRIEQLAVTNEQLVATNEALTAKLATCEKYRDAYDEMGRIGTQAVRDLEAKLAKAVEGQKVNALKQILEERGAVFDAMVDAAEDAAGKDVSFNVVVGRALRAAIAEIKGESHE